MVEPFVYPILNYRVIDGDTVKCMLDLGFGARMEISVRIGGINMPEKFGDEKVAGLAVKSLLIKWLDGHKLYARSDGWGKYAKRCIGEVFYEDGKPPMRQTVSEFILSNDLGRPYDGGNRKEFNATELALIVDRCSEVFVELKLGDTDE